MDSNKIDGIENYPIEAGQTKGMTFKEALDLVFKELENMSQEEFDKMIEAHKNEPLAQALLYAWEEKGNK